MPYFDSLQEWLSWQENSHPLTIDMGLERVAQVYRALNLPTSQPPTITIAGTNGKGSCIPYLESIYQAQGYRVGAYTSPHLLLYNERIKINSVPVADELITTAFSQIEQVRNNISLSYFEWGTLAALIIFANANLDIRLLEVGLGGRLDAVNIINPDATIISSIGIDHVAWLGNNREAIGYEKAGIFRAKIPAIVGDPAPPKSVCEVARNLNATYFLINQDFGYDKSSDCSWTWYSKNKTIENLPQPGLKGEHQYRNAASVLMAIEQLQNVLPVSLGGLINGLKNVCLAGRFELLPGYPPVLLDVGHNPEAVTTLSEHLAEYFPDRRIHAVFAMMKDKDISSVLAIMKAKVYQWFFAPLSNPRAANATLIREIFSALDINNAHFEYLNFDEAFSAAQHSAEPGDLILVFGSFFLVSECLAKFNN